MINQVNKAGFALLQNSVKRLGKVSVSRSTIGLSNLFPGRLFNETKVNLKQKLSYCNVSTEEPLLGETIGNLIDRAADKYATMDAVVVCQENIKKNFIEMKRDVDKFAAGLLAIGLQRGDRIGIWSPNNYEWLLTQYAAAKAGLILVTINPAYQTSELEYCLQKVGVRAVVSAATYKTQNYYRMFNELMPTLSKCKPGNIENNDKPQLKNFTHLIMISNKAHEGAFMFDDVLSRADSSHFNELEELQQRIDFDSTVNIQFTSGTTGHPKGVILTHHGYVNNCNLFGRRLGYHKENHRLCVNVPLFHTFGSVLASVTGVVFGACQVFPAPTFDAKATAEAIHNEKCTVLYGTPTMYVDVLHLPDSEKYDFSSVKMIVAGGAAIPLEIAEQLRKKFDTPVLNGFGMTETSCAVLVPKLTDSREVQMTKALPLEHTEVKIVNPQLQIVPRGIAGELLIRSYGVMHGYWDDLEKTNEVLLPDGWFRSGDIAVMDDNGYVQLIARIKDMIIRGGENIAPKEIEDFLHTHPKVVEVQVVGVPDPRYGEEVCAWISVKKGETLTEQEVKDFCKNKIARYKIPKYVMFTDVFPKTSTGKILKYVIKAEAVKALERSKK